MKRVHAGARLKHTCGPLSNVLLYALFFLPTSINTAWLSVAAGLGVLIVPVSYGITANMDVYAVVVATVITVIGAPLTSAHRFRLLLHRPDVSQICASCCSCVKITFFFVVAMKILVCCFRKQLSQRATCCVATPLA